MYYPCSENKGADQLRGYREADLCLCSRICKKPVFSLHGSYSTIELYGFMLKVFGNKTNANSLHTEYFCMFFSSPEPLGSQGELIVYPSSRRPSGVRRPPFSKIFFSETAWPIKAIFYVEHLWEGGTKVYINGPGHMTKIAATSIYGKNPSKIFFSRTGRPIFTKLGM